MVYTAKEYCPREGNCIYQNGACSEEDSFKCNHYMVHLCGTLESDTITDGSLAGLPRLDVGNNFPPRNLEKRVS